MIVVVLLMALVLLLAPWLSGVPDEPLYSSWLCAAAMLAVLVAAGRNLLVADMGRVPARRAEKSFAALLGIALLSLAFRLVVEHGIAYVGPMLRGWTLLATDFALFALARRAAQAGRLPAYALVLTALLASAIVAATGVTEYLTHRRLGDAGWRIFATSTPDFLAGYLVLLLPLTLALFVALPLRGPRPLISYLLAGLLLVVLAEQTASLLFTQSRFGLVSVAVGVLVFLLAAWRARRSLDRSSWGRLGGIVLFIALIGLGLAKPVLNRLRHTSAGDNSTAFRILTWRGSVNMAAANPVLGTGVGTYVHLYPRYAITGFTRLAHESYIQMADECGLPGLLALLLTLGFTFAAALSPPSPQQPPRPNNGEPGGSVGGQFLSFVAPADDQVLRCGLLGGLAAGVVQNLIDSDWYVFFLGVTFWTLAGLAAGLGGGPHPAPPLPKPPHPGGKPPTLSLPGERVKKEKPTLNLNPLPSEERAGEGEGRSLATGERGGRVRAIIAVGAALIMVRMATQGIAASYDQQATAAAANPDPAATPLAEQGWADARSWDPLNARYPSYLGFKVFFQREGRPADAEGALRDAVRLEPSSLNDSTLAAVLAQEHKYAEAIQTLQDGLRSEPNSLDLRLTLAQMLPPPQSTEYLRQITQLEDSPVGRVRAIGNITEYKFAIADAGVADAAANPAEARRFYQRAARLLESYADEGGTTNVQRQVLIGDHPSPALDNQMRQLYAHVMGRLVALASPADRPALQAAAQKYDKKYAAVFAGAAQ